MISEAFHRKGDIVKYRYLPWKRGVIETKKNISRIWAKEAC
jgi:hypothetical protein